MPQPPYQLRDCRVSRDTVRIGEAVDITADAWPGDFITSSAGNERREGPFPHRYRFAQEGRAEIDVQAASSRTMTNCIVHVQVVR